jgi:hypothetical protein
VLSVEVSRPIVLALAGMDRLAMTGIEFHSSSEVKTYFHSVPPSVLMVCAKPNVDN